MIRYYEGIGADLKLVGLESDFTDRQLGDRYNIFDASRSQFKDHPHLEREVLYAFFRLGKCKEITEIRYKTNPSLDNVPTEVNKMIDQIDPSIDYSPPGVIEAIGTVGMMLYEGMIGRLKSLTNRNI